MRLLGYVLFDSLRSHCVTTLTQNLSHAFINTYNWNLSLWSARLIWSKGVDCRSREVFSCVEFHLKLDGKMLLVPRFVRFPSLYINHLKHLSERSNTACVVWDSISDSSMQWTILHNSSALLEDSQFYRSDAIQGQYLTPFFGMMRPHNSSSSRNRSDFRADNFRFRSRHIWWKLLSTFKNTYSVRECKAKLSIQCLRQ